jgi:Flp pilus assembly protein TadG
MPSHPAVSLRNLLRRFRRSRRGSAVVQFALVAPAFFALLFAIIETALMFFASQVLETITQSSARDILTGQAQNAALTQSQFQTYVCNQIPALFTCSNLQVDVESFSSFAAINLAYDPCNTVNNVQYSPGGPGDVVVVRLIYPWQLFVTSLGYNISTPCMSGNRRQLIATAAFQNEPY